MQFCLIPAGEFDKPTYFRYYTGLDYLEYTRLLGEIGIRYFLQESDGSSRSMTPAEIDMALYMYDKRNPAWRNVRTITGSRTDEKIAKVMAIVESIHPIFRTFEKP